MAKLSLVLVCGVAIAVGACSSTTQAPGQAPADDTSRGGGEDTGPASPAGSSDGGASSSSDARAPTDSGAATPSSFDVTATVTPTCKFDDFNLVYRCELALTNVVVSPALPASTSVHDFDVNSENFAPPDAGWLSGLVVTSPSYPSGCMQDLSWEGATGTTLDLEVWPKTRSGSNCGLITAQHPDVTSADFANGFTATMKAEYKPTHSRVDLRVTFTR